MSLTALLWLLAYIGAAVGSFLNPVFGMLGYFHEYYNRPELKWWGHDLPAFRWNLIISMVFGATFLLRRSTLPKMAEVKNLAMPWLIALQVIMLIVTPLFALSQEASWYWSTQWTKMALVFPLLIIGVLRTRRSFNLFVAAHMLGGLWWGWDSWRDPKRIAGRLQNVGSGDSLDDNSAASHLITILPLTLVYLLTEKDKRLRLLALAATPFIVNTLILCNSRGSMLGVLGALMSTMILVRRGYRMRLAGVGIVMMVGFLLLADPQFIARQQTTVEHSDGSSQERIETWIAGFRLVKDHPLGTGGRGFHILSPKYIPSIVDGHDGEPRGPHNTYVMIASEWGILGLIAYIGYMASTFRMLTRVRKAAQGEDFYYWRALGLQVGLIAFLISAVFSQRLYAEVGYWMCAASFALYRLQATELAEEGTQPAADPQPVVQAPFAPARLPTPA